MLIWAACVSQPSNGMQRKWSCYIKCYAASIALSMHKALHILYRLYLSVTAYFGIAELKQNLFEMMQSGDCR